MIAQMIDTCITLPQTVCKANGDRALRDLYSTGFDTITRAMRLGLISEQGYRQAWLRLRRLHLRLLMPIYAADTLVRARRAVQAGVAAYTRAIEGIIAVLAKIERALSPIERFNRISAAAAIELRALWRDGLLSPADHQRALALAVEYHRAVVRAIPSFVHNLLDAYYDVLFELVHEVRRSATFDTPAYAYIRPG